MKLALFGKFLFFIASLYPLLLLLLLNESSLNIELVSSYPFITINLVIIFIITLICFIFPYVVISKVDLPPERCTISMVADSTSESLNYLVAIILGLTVGQVDPFLKINVWIILILFYLLYDTGGLFYIQPTLILLGYKVFKCEVNDEKEILVISKKTIKKDMNIKVHEITDKIVVFR